MLNVGLVLVWLLHFPGNLHFDAVWPSIEYFEIYAAIFVTYTKNFYVIFNTYIQFECSAKSEKPLWN